MSSIHPRLPGDDDPSPPRRLNEPAHRLSESDRAQLELAIMSALASGPVAKWQLARSLRRPDTIIYHALQDLSHARCVKRVGRNSRDARWALYEWQAPPDPPRAPDLKRPRGTIGEHSTQMVHRAQKPPARDSWWTRPPLQHDRAAFYAEIRAKDHARQNPTGRGAWRD